MNTKINTMARSYLPSDLPRELLVGLHSSMSIGRSVVLVDKTGKRRSLRAFVSAMREEGRMLGVYVKKYKGSKSKTYLYKPSRLFYAAHLAGYSVVTSVTYDDCAQAKITKLHNTTLTLEIKRDRLSREISSLQKEKDSAEMDVSPIRRVATGNVLSADIINERSVGLCGALVGVYFLLDGGEIVYVGMTTNFTLRLKQHVDNPEKQFSRYYFHPCKLENIAMVESFYMDLFNPKYNVGKAHKIPAEPLA